MTDGPVLRVMFYVQHLLGIGHLMRARRIALALHANGIHVTLVTGGLPVAGFESSGVDQIALPPLAVSDGNFSALVDGEGVPVDEAYKDNRRARLLEVFGRIRPDIVMLEAFPFGRRQLRFELLPLIEAIQASEPKPLLVTSIRDVLQRRSKAGRDEETADTVNSYFDKVLVHGDPNFTPLEETFPLADAIADKIAYTGLVCGPVPKLSSESYSVVVSAGGGAVGSDLLHASIEAAALLPQIESWCVIAGPYLPRHEYEALANHAPANVTVERFRADFTSLLATTELSISQAGYNTVSDVLQAQCRALLVPFSSHGETEQADRAVRLQQLGLATVVPDDLLMDKRSSGQKLASIISTSMATESAKQSITIDCDGANGTASVLQSLIMPKGMNT